MLKTITPIDNSVYVKREYASPQTIENALEKSRNAYEKWQQFSLEERKKIVTKFVENFLNNNKEIEEQLCRQMGRPISQCPGEMRGFKERALYMIEKSDEALQKIISKNIMLNTSIFGQILFWLGVNKNLRNLLKCILISNFHFGVKRE